MQARLKGASDRPRTGSRPEYRVVDATGPDHEKLFRVEVVVEGRVLGAGQGPSRRVAETAAAVHALEALRRETAERGAGGSGLRAELAVAEPTTTAEPAEPDDQPSQLTG